LTGAARCLRPLDCTFSSFDFGITMGNSIFKCTCSLSLEKQELIDAVKNEDLERVMRLIHSGADIDERDASVSV